jgi:hypothetical protein
LRQKCFKVYGFFVFGESVGVFIMSKKKRNRGADLRSPLLSPSNSQITVNEIVEPNKFAKREWFAYLKNHYWAVGIVAFLSLGILGAGLSYLEKDAMRQNANNEIQASNRANQSWLNRINPFVSSPPLPTSTPQLSKEYIYAGSRLLAVEDVNATAAPPADLAVWRASSGEWWVLGGTGSQQITQQWGVNGDVTVPGDYDGDGKTDFSVFRPSDNNWYVLQSSNGSYLGLTFGLSGDKTAQADYDGDGRTDRAVFRPSNGTWYIWQSSTDTYIAPQFGLSTDTPAPADYDGDGKADIAVWRNSSATFYILRSSDGQFQGQAFGQSGDIPVCGDYDGDGKADFAVRRGADWLILNSSNGQQQTINWQQSGDVAVPNDYDGDGKVDIAVWRGSGTGVGNWYIRQSSLGGQLRQVLWGAAGDIPVPAFYRR